MQTDIVKMVTKSKIVTDGAFNFSDIFAEFSLFDVQNLSCSLYDV